VPHRARFSRGRPARVKPFFLVVPFVQPTADQREAQLAFSLSFLERFFVRPFDTANRRPGGGAHNASIPNFQTTDSPYFHPHSWWSCCSGASWVFSIGNGCCRLGAELDIAVSSDFVPSACRSHPNSAICFESCQAAFFPAARRF